MYLFGLAALLFVSHVDRETDLANHYHTFSLILTKCQLHLLYFEQILNNAFQYVLQIFTFYIDTSMLHVNSTERVECCSAVL